MPDAAGPAAGAAHRPRRFDPARRDRIVDACLDVLAEAGVAGTSHRKVAAAADVPLGSMTYHFDGMEELLHEAFGQFTQEFAATFERRMTGAQDRDSAVEAVVQIVTQDVFASRRDLVLTHELYVLAAREPAYRVLTDEWMRRSRAALERHFDPATARLLDALIEGLTLHRALATGPHEDIDVAEAVRRITTPAAR
ncbi:TetR/AcrR family transcriptional regulator [Cellulomonas sp. PhB143]|uniref:TetR/AcrR family transcriptional regulator n=1 Tax=Cellulomonas sp. PhB143 TaxID=2485186 RepID=UPI001F25E97A|nr:TetR family transcriptional regulator [Cellulomonas sp. PhB143]